MIVDHPCKFLKTYLPNGMDHQKKKVSHFVNNTSRRGEVIYFAPKFSVFIQSEETLLILKCQIDLQVRYGFIQVYLIQKNTHSIREQKCSSL